MSNTDSFIEEVTEEVRRDQLYATLKRWGWLGVLAVLLLVGGAAWNEWRKSSEASAAQSFGDALLAGIEADDQGASLATVPVDTAEHAALVAHLSAADALAGGATETAIERLDGLASVDGAPAIYNDLARFKAALAQSPELPASERLTQFEAIISSGSAFGVLAEEQKALLLIEMGENDEALTVLNALLDRATATPGLHRRVSELIVALGGTPGET